ncbi:hypothetical protein, partial [Klebsiella pneumoniae]|uniref:hypothetical protein n=1 Tax=Klebsiella pneumoniae TaxID=573 RepID=UPI00210DBB54
MTLTERIVALHAALDGAGIPHAFGGALALATLTAFGWWLLRRGLLPFITGIALVPFFLLDWFPYASPTGLALSGIWLGVFWTTLTATEGSASTPIQGEGS